jgi:hypothetical protein
MNDKTMARADFFKYVIGKTASLVSKAAEDFTKPLSAASVAAVHTITKPLLSVGEFDCEIKLLASSTPPLFLMGDLNKGISAISALCENDSFLLSYQAHDETFFCGVCGATHKLNRLENGIEIDLETIPLVIVEGNICLLSRS